MHSSAMRWALFGQLSSRSVGFFYCFAIYKNVLINKNLKERSSSQRKELFKTIQMREGVNAVQLLLDMKIRWGSTHVMLKHALSRRSVSITFPIVSYNNLMNNLQCMDTFVYEMGCIAGGESIEKCRKIDKLRLTAGEWERVQTFEKLLAVCHVYL